MRNAGHVPLQHGPGHVDRRPGPERRTTRTRSTSSSGTRTARPRTIRIADGLVEAPPNIGPASFPEGYEKVSSQATYYLGTGEAVFVGPRADPFYVDLGSIFDLPERAGPRARSVQRLRPERPRRLRHPHDRDLRSRSISSRRTARCRPTSPTRTPSSVPGPRPTVRRSARSTPTASRHDLGALAAGLASRQPARQRGRHPGRPEGQVQRHGAEGRPRELRNVRPELRSSPGCLNGVLGVPVPPNPRTDLLVLVQGLDGVTKRPGRGHLRPAAPERRRAADADCLGQPARRARRRPRGLPQRPPRLRRRRGHRAARRGRSPRGRLQRRAEQRALGSRGRAGPEILCPGFRTSGRRTTGSTTSTTAPTTPASATSRPRRSTPRTGAA